MTRTHHSGGKNRMFKYPVCDTKGEDVGHGEREGGPRDRCDLELDALIPREPHERARLPHLDAYLRD